jgi:hypothetical protein
MASLHMSCLHLYTPVLLLMQYIFVLTVWCCVEGMLGSLWLSLYSDTCVLGAWKVIRSEGARVKVARMGRRHAQPHGQQHMWGAGVALGSP